MIYKITNVELPKNENEWGLLQINDLHKTFFRFELDNGEGFLDGSYFIDKGDPEEKHKRLDPSTDLYRDVQQALNLFIKFRESLPEKISDNIVLSVVNQSIKRIGAEDVDYLISDSVYVVHGPSRHPIFGSFGDVINVYTPNEKLPLHWVFDEETGELTTT